MHHRLRHEANAASSRPRACAHTHRACPIVPTAFRISSVRRSAFGTPANSPPESPALRRVRRTGPCSILAARCRWRRAHSSDRHRSWPQIEAVPPLFTTNPPRILMKVDLPAPFGPSRPKKSAARDHQIDPLLVRAPPGPCPGRGKFCRVRGLRWRTQAAGGCEHRRSGRAAALRGSAMRSRYGRALCASTRRPR